MDFGTVSTVYNCFVFHSVAWLHILILYSGSSWSWSYSSWIYNYMCNQCISPLQLWVRIPLMARCTKYNL